MLNLSIYINIGGGILELVDFPCKILCCFDDFIRWDTEF